MLRNEFDTAVMDAIKARFSRTIMGMIKRVDHSIMSGIMDAWYDTLRELDVADALDASKVLAAKGLKIDFDSIPGRILTQGRLIANERKEQAVAQAEAALHARFAGSGAPSCPHCRGTGWRLAAHHYDTAGRTDGREFRAHPAAKLCDCPAGDLLDRRLSEPPAGGGKIRPLHVRRFQPGVDADPFAYDLDRAEAHKLPSWARAALRRLRGETEPAAGMPVERPAFAQEPAPASATADTPW